MEYQIKNDLVTLKVATHAAEILSFKRNDDDYEYMWNGDKAYWSGRNPILFPQVSSTKNKINEIYGNNYPMGNHGFARNSEFSLVECQDEELTLVLKDNEETQKQYPFYFELYVTYKLVKNSVEISYKVVNKDLKTMPFGFGQHPAFNCPLGFKDTSIVFDEKECLVISTELFKQQPTVMYNPNTFSSAVLNSNGHQLKVNFTGYEYLAIWSPNAPFVCIEPWHSLPCVDGIAFEDREDIIMLEPKDEPGSSWMSTYSIELVK